MRTNTSRYDDANRNESNGPYLVPLANQIEYTPHLGVREQKGKGHSILKCDYSNQWNEQESR